MGQLNDKSVLLAIDTCGAHGTLALARVADGLTEPLGERVLPVRNAAAAILGELQGLLAAAGMRREDIGVIVVVNGPGSFTGVRIGVSAALGLSAGGGARVVAVSRLELLAALGRCEVAALDAHRHEVYVRVEGRETLANLAELRQAGLDGCRVAVCEDAAAELLRSAAPAAEIIRCAEPSAAFAIEHARGRIARAEFTDPLALDGNYLRRSDAEIFWSSLRASR